jgi:hypothetical protein
MLTRFACTTPPVRAAKTSALFGLRRSSKGGADTELSIADGAAIHGSPSVCRPKRLRVTTLTTDPNSHAQPKTKVRDHQAVLATPLMGLKLIGA